MSLVCFNKMRGSYSGNTSAFQADAESSILLPRSIFPCVAQPGRAPGLGPGGRMFESCHTDQFNSGMEKEYLESLISSSPWCDSRSRNHNMPL
jgi:hypothetical protein